MNESRPPPESAIVVLEHEVAGLREQISGLATKGEVAAVAGQVTTLVAEVRALNSSQRTPWSTLGTWAGVLLAVILAAAGLVHNQLSIRVDGAEHLSATRHDAQTEMLRITTDRIGALRAEFDAHAAHTRSGLQRQESQLYALSSLANVTAENNRAWISEHHYHLYGRPLPDKRVWPVVGEDRGAQER